MVIRTRIKNNPPHPHFLNLQDDDMIRLFIHSSKIYNIHVHSTANPLSKVFA